MCPWFDSWRYHPVAEKTLKRIFRVFLCNSARVFTLQGETRSVRRRSSAKGTLLYRVRVGANADILPVIFVFILTLILTLLLHLAAAAAQVFIQCV